MIVGRREMSSKREELKVSALHLRLMTLSIVVIGLMCIVFCEQLMVQVIHWEPFGFYFPSAYLAATLVVPEAFLSTAILIFVVLTWVPARKSPFAKSQSLLQNEAKDDNAVPSRYADF